MYLSNVVIKLMRLCYTNSTIFRQYEPKRIHRDSFTKHKIQPTVHFISKYICTCMQLYYSAGLYVEKFVYTMLHMRRENTVAIESDSMG